MFETASRDRFRPSVLTATLCVLTLLTALPAAADDDWCENDWKGDRVCEVRTMNLEATGRLAVDAAPNGGISVEAWDRDEIEVIAKVVADGRSESDSRQILSEITIETSGGDVRARGPNRSSWRKSWWVSYRIKVPARTNLDLESTNGGISIAGVSGDIEFATTNGGATLSRLGGDVKGRTTNGGLKVELSGSTWQGDGLDVQTTNGGVVIKVPEGYNARLDTGTTNGRTRIDFPVTVQGEIGKRLELDLGAGGPTVRVRTTNGGVRVERP